MTKREEAEQAMRLGDDYASEEYRVRLVREAINEALEEAATVASDEAARIENEHVRGAAIELVAARIRALKKEG